MGSPWDRWEKRGGTFVPEISCPRLLIMVTATVTRVTSSVMELLSITEHVTKNVFCIK